ncbi:GntR family transcriptional regulator [Sinomicrobium soli]|uniref:GntR family transcriptional regulator n=1 Tax=Sinomicrobium sp. N-1-3-6 TaxID=2219864 RepID=UPI000DCC44B5|nr:GntR family transcriptional regulator [Sinomicrobium sp. N-1-3-6]RAV27816.1 transcriptional regulator [Sinomicrobium sp. N-1-3-6]
MNVTSPLTDIHIDEQSEIPKYVQIAESIIKSITRGTLKVGQKIPSINEVCYEFYLSRDTVGKAYNLLKKKKIIISVPGKGYYTTRTDLISRVNILFMVNKPSSYKLQIYNAFVNAVGVNAHVNLSVYHCEEYLFVKTLEKNMGMYDYYVIMPHFRNKDLRYAGHMREALKMMEKIPKHKLLLLDNGKSEISGNYASVYQDFENDIIQALTEGLERLQNYDRLLLVYPAKAVHPYPSRILHGFRKFCLMHSFDFEVLDQVSDEMEPQSGDVYITIEENDLVNLVKQVREQGLTPGKDMGIISYNDTPLKELLGITVISTDFKKMGETAAEMILNNTGEHIKNTFRFLNRGSV